MTTLFSELALGSLNLSNRIIVSPMCQYSARDGLMQPWHQTHLGTMALSGAGLLMVEATAVEPRGRITPACVGLFNDSTEDAMRHTIHHVRQISTMPIGLQLGHAGRKASSDVPWRKGVALLPDEGGWQTVAPSAIAHREAEPVPNELDDSGLAKISESFRLATQRACSIGFDLIEIHMAHGYLMHQFLSPVANQRTDQFGGTLENRMRFPLSVFDEVKNAIAASGRTIPIGVRLSASDWLENVSTATDSWTIEQSVVFCQQLQAKGCDFIDVSSAGISPLQEIEIKPGYQVPFAEQLKQSVDIPVTAVGLITDPAHANQIISENKADAVMLGRGFLADPRWPWRAAAALGATLDAPAPYWRCIPSDMPNPFSETTYGTR